MHKNIYKKGSYRPIQNIFSIYEHILIFQQNTCIKLSTTTKKMRINNPLFLLPTPLPTIGHNASYKCFM